MAQARKGTSMYAQLLALALALAEAAPEPLTEHELVRELAHYRVRLVPRWGVGGGSPVLDAASSLAGQIDYDLTLLRLCRLRGVPCSPEQFSRPQAARRRLERALRESGVPVAASG